MKKALKTISIIVISMVSSLVLLDYIFDKYSCDEFDIID